MQKTQLVLTCLVILLVGLILYQEWMNANLDRWIKGVAVLCIVTFFVRIFAKYRNKKTFDE